MVRLRATVNSQVLAVVLAAALQHPQPGFLEKVFGGFTAAGQVNQIAQQTMLILFDQPIQQVGIVTPKSASDGSVLGLHPVHEIAGRGVHAI
jgi:hypothetical protein